MIGILTHFESIPNKLQGLSEHAKYECTGLYSTCNPETLIKLSEVDFCSVVTSSLLNSKPIFYSGESNRY